MFPPPPQRKVKCTFIFQTLSLHDQQIKSRNIYQTLYRRSGLWVEYSSMTQGSIPGRVIQNKMFAKHDVYSERQWNQYLLFSETCNGRRAKFNGLTTIVGHLMTNPAYTYIYIYDLVWFYGILTIVVHLMLYPPHAYTLNIYDLVWLGFMAY